MTSSKPRSSRKLPSRFPLLLTAALVLTSCLSVTLEPGQEYEAECEDFEVVGTEGHAGMARCGSPPEEMTQVVVRCHDNGKPGKIGHGGKKFTCDTTTTTLPPPTTTTTEAPPCVAVAGSIQTAVNAHPAGTAFCLSGTYTGQSVSPKDGQSFTGPATLDGNGAAIAFRPTGDDVTIRGLRVTDYRPGAQVGAIHAGGHNLSDATEGWTVEGNEVDNNDGVGIRIGSNMIVRGNHVHHNGQLGIGGVGNNTLIEANEIAYNNPDRAYSSGWEAGGTKFVKTTALIVRGNNVHHNRGPGLWTDIDNVNALTEGNLVEANEDAGIFHEISYAAVIRNNIIIGNGFGKQQWAYGAGIIVAHSPDVEVYGNTLDGNWNGIMGIQQSRGSGLLGPYELRNLNVHDNIIVIRATSQRDSSGNGAWLAGLATDSGAPIYSLERNNRFTSNDYEAPNLTGTWWSWANGRRTWTAWRGYGHDATGTFELGS